MRDVHTSIDCWIVCEERRGAACANGYERMVSILKVALGESAVRDFATREQFRADIKGRIAMRRGGRLLIVGHRADLRRVNKDMFRELAAVEGLDLLELQFTTGPSSAPDLNELGEICNCRVPYCSIPELLVGLCHATFANFRSQDRLNELIGTFRAEVQRSIIDPLLPLAVLVDGFLVACPQEAAEWFKPGREVALKSSLAFRNSVAAEAYWAELAESRIAVNRIGKMLSKLGNSSRGSPAILVTARTLGWSGEPRIGDPNTEAGEVYRRACEAVKAVWNTLTLMNALPVNKEAFKNLFESASIGFHVLAAGHL